MRKNHKDFLRKPKQICLRLHGNKRKTFGLASYELEAEQAGFKNEKKNWEQHVNAAKYWL